MIVRSFPVDFRAKLTLVVAGLILAGCGGSPQGKTQIVAGNGFRFEAPAGWRVDVTGKQAMASRDSELVQVSTFPLVKPYSDALFDRVTKELDARMSALAKQVGGTVAGSGKATAAGIRSHSYRVDVAGHSDEYTFVLRGRREYQLLCRRKTSSGDGFCKQLVRSFALA
jgi:hypothetical protein